MTRAELTARQAQVLKFIISYTRQNGFPPSVRNIGDAVGLKSSSSVHSHLNALEKKGYIFRNSSSARAITVNEELLNGVEGFEDLCVEESNIEDPLEEVYRDIIALPLVGRVAAGSPILAEENIEETIGLPAQIVGDSSSFLLTIQGDSMIEAGILDGDIVVVKQQNTANNGDIVVAMIDEQCTVKSFFREPDRIRLQPQNSTMEPIYSTDVSIIGKVTGLFRSIR